MMKLLILQAIRKATTLSPGQDHIVADAVAREIEPVVKHKTNNEPWYQSRVTIGALVSIASGGAAIAGYALSPDDIALITNTALAAVGVFGGIVSLYGRWAARKPLGS